MKSFSSVPGQWLVCGTPDARVKNAFIGRVLGKVVGARTAATAATKAAPAVTTAVPRAATAAFAAPAASAAASTAAPVAATSKGLFGRAMDKAKGYAAANPGKVQMLGGAAAMAAGGVAGAQKAGTMMTQEAANMTNQALNDLTNLPLGQRMLAGAGLAFAPESTANAAIMAAFRKAKESGEDTFGWRQRLWKNLYEGRTGKPIDA